MPNQIKLTLVKSIIGRKKEHIGSVKGLGLTGRMNQSVVVKDTKEIRGMINKVNYLLKIEELA